MPMTADMVHWFLDLFEELGITVWIDAGWGVDALLGECTRPHEDLDIMTPWPDSRILTEALLARGFDHVHTDDRKDRNFVMAHRARGKIDFHVFDLLPGGGAVYGPGEINWTISASELRGEGSIGGREVRCPTPDPSPDHPETGSVTAPRMGQTFTFYLTDMRSGGPHLGVVRIVVSGPTAVRSTGWGSLKALLPSLSSLR